MYEQPSYYTVTVQLDIETDRTLTVDEQEHVLDHVARRLNSTGLSLTLPSGTEVDVVDVNVESLT